MASPLDSLVELIHSGTLESWKDKNDRALAALWGTRYPKRAEKSVALRAPGMRNEGNVAYAAYIHPSNPDSGVYGGMSLVLFPVEGEPCLVAMCVGTQGLSPDETILGRPGHSRKMRAVADWLNHKHGRGVQIAWAKQDATRTDIGVPEHVEKAWTAYGAVFERYGKYLYALYRPTDDRAVTQEALSAFLDLMLEERGQQPLQQYARESGEIQAGWFAHLMPRTNHEDVADLLSKRRFVVLQGPPGTGKTRMARQILERQYGGAGRTVQFHPSTTYENFIGGLAPVHAPGDAHLGFRFMPKAGFLMEAAAQAATDISRPYLLHIDEINRADLSKILGEAIYLLEPRPESQRCIQLPYDFGEPFHDRLYLPDNLHILGTMNSSDRSIAILDVAVRRRFAFISLWPQSDVVAQHGCDYSLDAYHQLLSIFVEHAPAEALALVPGHSYFLQSDEAEARKELKSTLRPLLEEYLAQGYVSGFAEPIVGYLQWLDSK